MKKHLIALTTVLLTVLSCSKATEPDPSVGTAVKEIEFSYEGGTQEINVFTEGVEWWDAYASHSWIRLEKDMDNGVLKVSADPCTSVADLEGRIVIYSQIDSVTEISVRQQGNGIIWDRTSKQLMNLKGRVKSVSSYCNPLYSWQLNPGYLSNLQFNEDGMLTHYEFFRQDMQKIKTTFMVDVSYDQDRRISEINATTTDKMGSYPLSFKMKFGYGNHGKYISTYNLFSVSDSWFCYIEERMWMPAMIRDLESIEVTSDFLTKGSIRIDIRTEGSTGTAEGTVGEEKGMVCEYTFAGDYTSKVESQLWFIVSYVPCHTAIEFDPETGNLISMVSRNDEVFGVFTEYKYNQDLANTCSYFRDEIGLYCRISAEYNDNCDLVSMYNDSRDAKGEFAYTYDEYGNWTSMEIKELTGDVWDKPETERTIEYYK